MSWLVFCTRLHWVLVPMSQSCCLQVTGPRTGLETGCPCPPPTGLPAQERRCPVRERVLGLSAGGSHSRKMEDDGLRACSQAELLKPFSCLSLCSPSQINSSCFLPISGLNALFVDISLCRAPSHFFPPFFSMYPFSIFILESSTWDIPSHQLNLSQGLGEFLCSSSGIFKAT